MRGSLSPRYFVLSVLLLVALLSSYIYFEARRLQRELLRQTEAKGIALAEAMEANIRASVQANALLEEEIGQRLLDNARLIDELLQFPRTDETMLAQIAAANRLSRIDLLDASGRPLEGLPAPSGRRMQEMMARMDKTPPFEAHEKRQAMMPYMWGRRWRLEPPPTEPPPRIADKIFWEGSAFGVAIGAQSFPGIIAVHANADYIVNFRKQIDVQRQIEELGRQPDIDHVVLVGNDSTVLAHTDPQRINKRHDDPLLRESKSNKVAARGIVVRPDGTRHFDVVRAVEVNGSPMGFLEIGLSLRPMEAAWSRSLRSTAIIGAGVLAVGILGLAVIFHNQRAQLEKVRVLEEEVHRKERLSELGDLAAMVAHEIRNPLNSVSMGMQRLKSEFTPAADAEEYGHFLDLMGSEVHRLNTTVEQFLSLARPLKLIREPIVVDGLIQEVVALVEAEAKAARTEIQVQGTKDLPPLWADQNGLKQLLLNLILNGIQAMPSGGGLGIAAALDHGFVCISVTDGGIGIEADKLEKIFDPYFSTKSKGSGLGLAIARRIAEAHGGKITADSIPGRGATFRVWLPLGPPESS